MNVPDKEREMTEGERGERRRLSAKCGAQRRA